MEADSTAATSESDPEPRRDPSVRDDADDAEARVDRLDRLERRVASLESELDALRALLGGVEAVDRAVERRASIALAKAEALEREFGADDPGVVRERLIPSDDESLPAQATREQSSDRRAADRGEFDGSASTTTPTTEAPADSSAPTRGDDSDPDSEGLAARLRGVLR
ncbi:MAG: hypothetical protein ABEJ97_08910 [Halobellus sp.]